MLSRTRPGEVIEVFIEDSGICTLTVVDGEIESSEERHEQGAGIRLFRDGRTGFSYTSALTPDALQRAVEAARALAAYTRREDANQAAPPRTAPAPRESAPPSPSFTGRCEIARRVEDAARSTAPGIKTRAAVATEATGRVSICHSAGLTRSWTWNRSWASIELVAREDDARQTGYESGWAPALAGLDPERIGAEAARQALRKMGASRPPTAHGTVVLDPRVAAGLFDALAGALSGKAVVRDRSLFAGRLGERVAAPAVTLVDDGAQPDGFDTAPFDGEGTPSTRAVLILEGTLQGFLQDCYTAARLGAVSTGHAVRRDHASLPSAGTRNLHLQPTGVSREAVLGAAGPGIYVDEVMGLHTVDPVTGDFSLGAVGRRIEGGEPGAPLEGFAISGNTLSLLRSVEAVADDLRFFAGATGGSTVLLREMLVSGA